MATFTPETIYEVTVQQTMQGQPVFNVFTFGAEEAQPPDVTNREVAQALADHFATDIWESWAIGLSEQWELEVMSVRKFLITDADKKPTWDIPDAISFSISGEVEESTSQAMPANACVYHRMTSSPDQFGKRHRSGKYLSGITEADQNNGAILASIITPWNTAWADFPSFEYTFETMVFWPILPLWAQWDPDDFIGDAVRFDGIELSQLITHQDRRRRGTARGGYFGVS